MIRILKKVNQSILYVEELHKLNMFSCSDCNDYSQHIGIDTIIGLTSVCCLFVRYTIKQFLSDHHQTLTIGSFNQKEDDRKK